MPRPPNILWIAVDSMRADHVHCYGYSRPTTPTIDRLAGEGCRFTQAISSAPFSPASYASLISGQYPHEHGVNGDTVRRWAEDMPRLPEALRERGYSTFCVSNNAFVSEQTNAHKGFDRFEGPAANRLLRWQKKINRLVKRGLGDDAARLFEWTSLQATEKGDSGRAVGLAEQMMSRAKAPFFGFVILMDPHAMYNPRHKTFLEGTADEKAFLREINGPGMWARLMARQEDLSPGQRRAAMNLYDSEIRHADDHVGMLLDQLRRMGALDDTIVAVFADHGEAFGEQGVWGHGFSLHDALCRVPLVVRCPRYWSAETRSDALVQLHDLNALALSVSRDGQPDLSASPHCLSQSADAAWPGRDYAFSHFPVQTGSLEMMRKHNPDLSPGRWAEPMWAVRSGEAKYIEYGEGDVEYYDLAADAEERSPVGDPSPQTRDAMARILAEHRGEVGATAGASRTSDDEQDVDPVVLERLENLGYI